MHLALSYYDASIYDTGHLECDRGAKDVAKNRPSLFTFIVVAWEHQLPVVVQNLLLPHIWVDQMDEISCSLPSSVISERRGASD